MSFGSGTSCATAGWPRWKLVSKQAPVARRQPLATTSMARVVGLMERRERHEGTKLPRALARDTRDAVLRTAVHHPVADASMRAPP